MGGYSYASSFPGSGRRISLRSVWEFFILLVVFLQVIGVTGDSSGGGGGGNGGESNSNREGKNARVSSKASSSDSYGDGKSIGGDGTSGDGDGIGGGSGGGRGGAVGRFKGKAPVRSAPDVVATISGDSILRRESSSDGGNLRYNQIADVRDPFLDVKRALVDWKLEDYIITVSISGKIQASDRTTGEYLWDMESAPLVNVVNHRRRNRGVDSDLEIDGEDYIGSVGGEDTSAEDEFEWIIQPGNGGPLYSFTPGTGISKGNFRSMKYIVDHSPWLHPNGMMFNGEKKTELYILDPIRGKLLSSSEGPISPGYDKWKKKGGLEGLEEEECDRTMSLARTEYTVIITAPEKGRLWTLKYIEWGIGNHNLDLAAQYGASMDNKYLYTLPNGHLICRDITKAGNQAVFIRPFDDHVVFIFDVVSSVYDKNLVLLPHPKDPALAGRVDDGYRYIDNYEGKGLYALPDVAPSGAAIALRETPASELNNLPARSLWNSMDLEDRRRTLIGVHQVKDFALSRGLSPPTIDANQSKDPQRSYGNGISAPGYLTEQPRKTENKYFQATALLCLLSAVWLAGKHSNSIGTSIRRYGLRIPTGHGDASHQVLDVSADTTMLKDRIPAGESSKQPDEVLQVRIPTGLKEGSNEAEADIKEDEVKIELKVDVDSPVKDEGWVQIPTPPNSPPTAPAVRFAPLPDDDDNGSDNDDGTPQDANKPKKKRKRGTRAGKRKNGIKKKDSESEEKASVDIPDVAVIHNPEPLLPGSSSLIADDLHVSAEVLGHGSHGTVVFKGKFGNRDVAVKRLLVDYYDVASHEVNLLQRVDDHPNVVRYYCQKQTESFLYIALELCPASLQEVFDRSEHKGILSMMDPPEVLRQMTLGVQHLHSLKIVHRDLKPQNILVAEPKRSLRDPSKISHPKILISDFGLCKKLEADQSSFRATTAHAAGTSGWRAPELLISEGESSLSGASEHTNGSTTDSSVLDTPTNRRATRAIDIFSLGCVFYFVLTRGGHPFGDRWGREYNIVQGKYNLSELDILGDSGYEARDLISSMIRRNPRERPDASAVLSHPFFWSAEKKLNFLLDVSDRFEKEERDPPSLLLQRLEHYGPEVFGPDWYKRLDKGLIDNLGKHRKYQGNRMLDLLRALRNKKHHYQDLPPAVQATVGSLPDGYLHYFTVRFPSILVSMFHLVRDELQEEAMFKTYLTS